MTSAYAPPFSVMAISVNPRCQMLAGGLMDSARAPIVSVITQVSDTDKWPNGWCILPIFQWKPRCHADKWLNG